MDYSKRIDNKESFKRNAFKIFTDACGGNLDEFTDTLYAKYIVEDFAYSDDMYYWGVLSYFKEKIIPHKIAVYQAGLELSRSEKFAKHLRVQEQEDFLRNLWLHDLSKFSANEAFGYAMYNFKDPHPQSVAGFKAAWHHHKMNNPHHPEYWLNPNRSGELEPLPMPKIYILEMIADWIGAGKTYGKTLEEWLPNNINTFKFTPVGLVAEMIRDFTGINGKQEDYKLVVE